MFKISTLTFIAVSLLAFFLFGGSITSQPPEATNTIDGMSTNIDVKVVVSGLETPRAIDFAPDGRIFITERPGRVRIVKNGQLLNEPWLSRV